MSEIARYRMVRACLVTAPDACLFEHPMGKYAMWADCKAALAAAEEKIAELEKQLEDSMDNHSASQMLHAFDMRELLTNMKGKDKRIAELEATIRTYPTAPADQPVEEKQGRRGETADETIRRMESAPRSQHVLDALRTACEAFHDYDDEVAEKKEEETQ